MSASLAGARAHRRLLPLVFAATTALSLALALAPTAGARPQFAHYKLRPLVFLGDPAPGGGAFANDFEPSAINNREEGAFTADVSTGGEGVFTIRHGQITQVTRTGLPAPGASTFGAGELGRLGFNEHGDVGVPFLLNPLGDPFGINAGIWRYTAATNTLSAVATPGTPMPGAGALKGLWFDSGMNNAGAIVFTGLAQGTDIEPGSPPGAAGAAGGVWEGRKDGTLVQVVIPGDHAPGGGLFDDARNPSINNAGDVAFGGHLAGETCYPSGPFLCTESLYLRNRVTGGIRSIAHQGDPAPGGGTFFIAFGGVINSGDQIVFLGSLAPPDSSGAFTTGVFRWSHGTTTAVARPGDAMPGGGHLASAGVQDETYGLNNAGEISFVAMLDTTSNGSTPDMGAYIYSHGAIHLIARTGTVIPGVGTISYFGTLGLSGPNLAGGAINSRRQVLLAATLTDGRVVLLLASPA